MQTEPRGTTPTQLTKKGGNNLPSPKAQAVTQKELHAIADEAIGNAKKIYIHYTPLEGAMVIKLLF